MTAKTPQFSRAITTLAGSLALAGLLSGCHIMVEEENPREHWYYCDAYACYLCDVTGCAFPGDFCLDDRDCGSGICDGATDTCMTRPEPCSEKSDCNRGGICDGGNCAPPPSSCDGPADCGDGAYCSDGQCKASGLCKQPKDCSDLGSGFTCDVSGSCVPAVEEQPQTCELPGDCKGGFCVDGLCGTCSGDCGGSNTCELSRHCGDGRSCLNGRCVAECSEAEADVCGSDQQCNTSLGVCVAADPTGCVHNSDCVDGSACVNGSCYVDCSASGDCADDSDMCVGAVDVGEDAVRVCRADHLAQPECELSKDCTGNEQCVNGTCRTTCLLTEDCETCDDGPVCGRGGFCMTELEDSAECKVNDDCDKGKVCLNAQCI